MMLNPKRLSSQSQPRYASHLILKVGTKKKETNGLNFECWVYNMEKSCIDMLLAEKQVAAKMCG